MVASLLYDTGRTARWFTALGASDIMCMARAPIRGQIPTNLVADPAGPLLEEGALAMTGPWTSYLGGIITHHQVSKC